jgi:hypothetical protein
MEINVNEDDVGVQPNYPLLEKICEGSDRAVDPQLKEMLLALKDKPLEEYCAGLHKALDFSAYASWTSDFVMQVMHIEWERVGGKHDDPAPWREEAPFSC